MIGETYGSMVVVAQATERGHHGSIIWALSCSLCGETVHRCASDLRRRGVKCQGSCRVEIARMSPIKDLYGRYRRYAVRMGREFALTLRQFHELLLNDCYYCSLPPAVFHTKPGMRRSVTHNGIDRVDNKVGYVLDNCVTACRFCNMAKGRLGTDEFIAWLDHIRLVGQRRSP